mmetsp:Transcript_85472/g.239304  ORF Transcript_85472/g.239304 Transcript_85472/m.239304 type:complete len:229 (-) Transcript_85472:957-1643(-)
MRAAWSMAAAHAVRRRASASRSQSWGRSKGNAHKRPRSRRKRGRGETRGLRPPRREGRAWECRDSMDAAGSRNWSLRSARRRPPPTGRWSKASRHFGLKPKGQRGRVGAGARENQLTRKAPGLPARASRGATRGSAARPASPSRERTAPARAAPPRWSRNMLTCKRLWASRRRSWRPWCSGGWAEVPPRREDRPSPRRSCAAVAAPPLGTPPRRGTHASSAASEAEPR